MILSTPIISPVCCMFLHEYLVEIPEITLLYSSFDSKLLFLIWQQKGKLFPNWDPNIPIPCSLQYWNPNFQGYFIESRLIFLHYYSRYFVIRSLWDMNSYYANKMLSCRTCELIRLKGERIIHAHFSTSYEFTVLSPLSRCPYFLTTQKLLKWFIDV